jgi:hypothetical protein
MSQAVQSDTKLTSKEFAQSGSRTPKVLLTSVCRPLGPKHGDGPSVGYELLYSQVTRAQGIFSPRTVNIHYSIEYIAENLDAPAVVLQYPSKREFIRELKKGYDYVGISFLMAVFHKMKEMVALVRQKSFWAATGRSWTTTCWSLTLITFVVRRV